jgi:Domain of unknown function DUF11
MSKNIAKNAVPIVNGFIQNNKILKTIMVLVAIFGLTFSALTNINVNAAPSTAPNLYIVNDLSDSPYRPEDPQTPGLNGTPARTLRWAIEQVNRDCNAAIDTPTIRFDFAAMSFKGSPAPSVTEAVTDNAGKYSVGSDVVYRIPLNTYLPDLICADTIIDGETGNPNAAAAIGTAASVGTKKVAISKIKRPAIEIYAKSNYIRPVSVGNVKAGLTTANEWKATRNCGLRLAAETQKVIGIAIFGFGGGEYNDANICVSPYSDAAPLTQPDPRGSNSEIDLATDYFPQVNAISNAFINGAVVDFIGASAPAELGAGMDNYYTQPSIYENQVDGANDAPFDGTIRGAAITQAQTQNSTDIEILRNVIGATAALKAPADPSFTGTYDTAKAVAMRTNTYHSTGSGVSVVASDSGKVDNNIIAFNGGLTGAVAGSGSQAGVLFDVAAYGQLNTYVDDAPALNAELWTMSNNEIYLNITNDRAFGGHGIFTNSNQNSVPGNGKTVKILNNDLYQNGGAGIRTFVPSIDIWGNKINDNGKHDNDEDDAFDVIDKTATYKVPRSYVPDVSSFKHGIWMECGDGYIYNNEIYNNAGAAIAVAGGNMYCPNGGLSQNGGNVISENSMYDNGSIGIDLFKENNSSTKAGVGGYVVYDKAPTNIVEYEKPIGSEQDIDSESQKTGDASTFQGAKGSKFVSLNTKLALKSTAQGVTETAFDLATKDPSDISATNERTLVGANLNTPFPVFTYSTIDCSTNKIKIHGYVAKDNVVEVFTPDKLTVETYAEGKTYLFDFTDNNTAFATTLQDIDLDLGTYSNTSKIVGEDNLPLSAGTIDDLPYYDAASGTLKTLSTAPTPFATVDKVHADEIMEGDLASEFTVETPLKIGDVINATASDYNLLPGEVGTTSEFSPNFLIQPINVCETASIVKSWDATPAVNPQPYSANDPLKFTITVYNESTTSTLSGFTIKDPTFDADVLKTLSCTTTEAGTPAGPFDLAALTTGVSFKPTTPIAIGGKVEFKCTETVIASPVTVAPAVITNKVTLAAFDPTKPTTLSIVKPKTGNTTAKDQTDGVTSPTVNDITNAEDSITAVPVSSKKLISIVKAWVTPPPTYIAGTPLDFTITITNEGTSDVTKFNLIDDNFGGKATGMTCDNGFTTFTGQDITLPAPLISKAALVIKCTGVVAPAPAGILTNKATLAPFTGDTTTNVVMPQTLDQSDKDPKTALTVIDTPEAKSDSISVPPLPSAPSYYIIKKVTTTPNVYTVGSPIEYDITVVNSTPSIIIKQVKMTDDCGAGKLIPCTYTPATGTYDSATGILSGMTFVAAADGLTSSVTVKSKGTVIAGTTGDITNTAKLDPTLPIDPANPAVVPVCKKDPTMPAQSDTTDLTTVCDDKVVTPPLPSAPSYYIIKKVTTTPNEYKVGSPLAYDIEIVNSTPSVKILQVKMTDDCGAAQLVPCTYTPASGTYDATTKIFTGMTWIASADGKTSSAIIKSTGIVLPTATGNVTNTAKLDKTFPIDPANPSVLPVCKKDPTMPAQSDTVDTDVCDDKVVTPPAGSPKASIIKTFAPSKVDALYKKDSVIDYIVTVTNEGSVDIKEFTLTDDSFGGKAITTECVGGMVIKADGTAQIVTLTAPLAPTKAVVMTCKALAPASDGVTTLTNTATLAGTATTPLSVVAPSGTPQSDGKQTDPADIPKDSVSIPPAPKDLAPTISIRKILTSGKTTFAPGDTITYDVIITKISGTVTIVKVDDDCAGGLLEGTTAGTPCTMISTDPTTYLASPGIAATGTSGTLSGIVWPASNEVTFKVTGKVKAGTTTDVINVASFDKTVPADPLNPLLLPACAIDPKMTNADGVIPSAADCNKDEVKITPAGLPKASIVKAFAPTKTVKTYALDDVIDYTITIKNEGDVDITEFNLNDDGFDGKVAITSCSGDFAFVAPFPQDVTLLAPLKKGESVKIICLAKAPLITVGKITNTATLAGTTNSPLSVVVPTQIPGQSDGNTTTPADIAKDSITIEPTPTIPTISIRKVLTSAKTFAPGDTVTYDVIITKIGGTVTQVKITDDCGGNLLESTTTPGSPCTLTSADGTFDAATLTLTAIKWSTANEAVFKVTGKVKAGTTTNITNVATFDPKFPADPANPTVLPVCSIDPKMTRDDKTVPTAADCNKDNVIITPAPLTPTISIRKVLTSAKTFAPGDTVTYDVIITKIGGTVTQVKITDDCGGNLLESTTTPGSPCTLTSADGTFDAATLTLTAIKWSTANEAVFKVTGKVKAGTTTNITNVATFDPKFPADPANPTVLPVCSIDPKMTRDDKTVPTAADCNKDNVIITPAPTPIYTIKKSINSSPNQYAAGETLDYTIRITNWTPAIPIKQVKLIDDCGAGLLENCLLNADKVAIYDIATNILSGIVWTKDPSGNSTSVSVTYSGKVKATTTTNIANTAKLDPTLPIDPLNPSVLPVCATDPKMQDFTNADGTIKVCEDDVITPPTPVLSIRKVLTSSKTTFAPGDTITYDVIVTKVAGNVVQVKVSDDCGGGKLEGTPVAPATTTPCTITSADGTFDPATGILTGAKWSATNEVVFKVSGKVKAGTTTDVVNVAKFDPNFPVDPKNPLVVPVCAIDPKMTNADPASPEKCTQDEVKITPTPVADKASIVKAWDFFTGYFTSGDTLAWTVTVTNEGTTDLTKFNFKDDNFAAAPELDATTFVCTTETPAPAFTSAQLLAGFDFVPTTPLKPGEFVEFACTVEVEFDGLEGYVIENTATLAPAAGQSLTRVPPTKLQQSDLDVSSQEQIDTDHIYVEPEAFIPNPPIASVLKKWVAPVKDSYSVGDRLYFQIIVANEDVEPIYSFTLQDDKFDGATNIANMTCSGSLNGTEYKFDMFAGQEFTKNNAEEAILPIGDRLIFDCYVDVTADSGQILKNTVTLIFPEGDIYEPLFEPQSDGLVGDPANDAIDSIKIKPKPKTIVPVVITPRTGGEIAIGASVLALISVAFLTLRKRVTIKK